MAPRAKTARKRKTETSEPILRVPYFQKFYATNVRGGATSQDFRFHLMNEKLRDRDEWHFVSDALVILTPTAAKRLLLQLEEYVKTYEKQHGKIPTEFSTEQTY